MLEFERRIVVAVDDNDFLGSSNNSEVSIAIYKAHISSVEPLIRSHTSVRINRIVMIALEDSIPLQIYSA